MPRLIFLLIFSSLVSAEIFADGAESTSDENDALHFLTVNYSQHQETLSLGNTEKEVSPNTFGVSYTTINSEGIVWRLDIWDEKAQGLFANGAKVQNTAWGGGVSFTYPMEYVDLELSYAHSKPSLEAWAPAGNRIDEQGESNEYVVGISDYFALDSWSMTAALQLGYQATTLQSHSSFNGSLISESASQSGWFVSPSLNVSYLLELNTAAELSPFLGISWTDFVQGKGLINTRATRRNISLSSEEEIDLDSSGSGVASIGLSATIERYQLDLSIDEAIDQASIGTQVNVGFGVVW